MLFAGYYLWIAPHVLLGVFLIFLVRRKLQRELPIFTCYVAFELIQFLVLFTLALRSPFPNGIYNWTLVFGAGIGSTLQLGVIYELASELLLSRSPLKPVLRPVLQIVLAVLLLGAAGASGAFSGISVQSATNTFQTIDFSSNLIEAGMVLALFVFARVLRVSWHSWGAGVVLGFGVAASIDLVSAALRAEWGKRVFIAADITQMAAFHVCVVIWLGSLFLVGRTPPFPDGKLKISDLELWDQELQRMVQR
jgi:hypothetical protein